MSKELEALEEIKRQVGNIHYFDFTQNMPTMTTIPLVDTTLFKIVENALKDYEKLKGEYDKLESIYTHFIKQYNQLLKDHSKMLKALEIIKRWTKITEWGEIIFVVDHTCMPKEEYDLLKEVL